MVRILELCTLIYLVAQWIFLSSSIILFNKYLLSNGFPHPCTLVGLHMAFSSVGAHAWRLLGWVDVPQLGMRQWLCGILPVGFCFAGSLVLSNMACGYAGAPTQDEQHRPLAGQLT